MIQRLLLHNFRGLAQADMTFGPGVTLALGQNGSGKSTIAEAIRFGLTGACEWTDGGGRGANVLIAHGAASAGVDLVADIGIVARQIGEKSNVTFGDRTGKDAAAALGAALPSEALLTAMLRSDGFLRLSGKEQQDLLFLLSGGETDAAWFKERLTAEEADVLDGPLATLLAGSALVDSLYQAAYTLRTEANRVLKQLAAQDAGLPMDAFTAEDWQQQTAAGEGKLAKLREKAGKLQSKIGGGQAAKTAHDAALARHQQADEEVKRVEQALAGLGESPEGETVDLAGLETHAGALRSDHTECVQSLAEANGSRQSLIGQLADFIKLGDKCVIGGLTCPLSTADRAQAISQIEHSIDKLEAEIEEQYRAAETAEADYNAACASLDAATKQEQEALRHRERGTQLGEELTRAQERRDAALAECQETPAVNTTALHKDLRLVNEQLQQAEADLRQAREAETAAGEAKRLQLELQKAESRAKLLDDLVKKLSPDGLPAQAMGETIGTVIGAINAVLVEFTEIVLSIQPGKDAEIWADLVNDRGEPVHLPARCLSESEKLRVGAAIQVAFAKLPTVPGPNGQKHPFGFVAVDAADRCDRVRLRRLLSMLLTSGVQALVASTPIIKSVPEITTAPDGSMTITGWHDEEIIPRAEGLTVYTLEAGRAVVAQEAAA